VPNGWNGRIWGRTACTFDATGNGRCQTGDCAGTFECAVYGTPPASLAEFNLANTDFYDVSLVDGFNLPLYINRTGGTTKDPLSANGCSSMGCTSNANSACPALLQVKNGTGKIIACKSACLAFGTPQYCCTGDAYNNAQKCDPSLWPTDYAHIFKAAEPFAYSFAYDDATSLFTCTGACNYRITFGTS
jgi:hypothetical protein